MRPNMLIRPPSRDIGSASHPWRDTGSGITTGSDGRLGSLGVSVIYVGILKISRGVINR